MFHAFETATVTSFIRLYIFFFNTLLQRHFLDLFIFFQFIQLRVYIVDREACTI